MTVLPGRSGLCSCLMTKRPDLENFANVSPWYLGQKTAEIRCMQPDLAGLHTVTFVTQGMAR